MKKRESPACGSLYGLREGKSERGKKEDTFFSSFIHYQRGRRARPAGNAYFVP